VFFDLGVVHLDAGNVAKAKQAFILAGKFATDSGDQRFSTLHAQVNYELAMLALEHDGDMMRASAHAWEYCRRAPANTEALELVDSIAEYLDSGRLSSEEREGAYAVHYNVASSYQLLGNLDKAASHYQTALAGLPEDETVLRYQACIQLAVLALEQGLVSRALGWVGTAKKTGVATADAYRVEGEIRLRTGDDARAAELFRKALELDPDDEASRARLKQLRSTL
jgi:tetratricopeptide (TPR) repeat protein